MISFSVDSERYFSITHFVSTVCTLYTSLTLGLILLNIVREPISSKVNLGDDLYCNQKILHKN